MFELNDPTKHFDETYKTQCIQGAKYGIHNPHSNCSKDATIKSAESVTAIEDDADHGEGVVDDDSGNEFDDRGDEIVVHNRTLSF